MRKNCCCSWTACRTVISEPAASNPSSAFSKTRNAKLQIRNHFCLTAFPWPNPSAAVFPSPPSGRLNLTETCSAPARTPPPSAAHPWAVALKILEVVREEKLDENARILGDFLKNGLQALANKYPRVIREVRGVGLMIGIELRENIPNLPGDPAKTQAVRFVNLLHAAGLLTIPAGSQVIRLLPALNLRQSEAEEGLKIIESVAAKLAG